VAQDFIDDRRTFPHLLQESLSAALGLNVEQVNTAAVLHPCLARVIRGVPAGPVAD